MLAKTAAYSIEMVTDRLLSLASQLLQGIFSEHEVGERHRSRVGAGLLAKTAGHSIERLADISPSLASQRLQGTARISRKMAKNTSAFEQFRHRRNTLPNLDSPSYKGIQTK